MLSRKHRKFSAVRYPLLSRDCLRSSPPRTSPWEAIFSQIGSGAEIPSTVRSTNLSGYFVFHDPTALTTKTQAKRGREPSVSLPPPCQASHPCHNCFCLLSVMWINALCLLKNFTCYMFIVSTLRSEISILCLDIQAFRINKNK